MMQEFRRTEVSSHVALRVAAEIEKAITDALEHHADIEAHRIRVIVEENVATLSGVLPSYREHQIALLAAQHTDGVREVHDLIRVDPLCADPGA